jgi:hypothetical protein
MESTTPTSAATKVFNIPELVESIIAFIPPREILAHVQRVSRTWKTIVDDSPLLQQRLGRQKGKAMPAETPTRIVILGDGSDYDLPDDFGVPIYKAPITINKVFKRHNRLYQDCFVSTFPAKNWDIFLGWSKHTIIIQLEARDSEFYPNGRQTFPSNPDLSWRSIQASDPPITVARMQTYSGVKQWSNEDNHYGPTGGPTFDDAPTGILATVFDKNGITLGLLHDTAAVILRSRTGEEDPGLGWHLSMCWGTEDGPEVHPQELDDADDEGGEDREDSEDSEDSEDDHYVNWWAE